MPTRAYPPAAPAVVLLVSMTAGGVAAVGAIAVLGPLYDTRVD